MMVENLKINISNRWNKVIKGRMKEQRRILQEQDERNKKRMNDEKIVNFIEKR